MRIYLAGSFARREEFMQYADLLQVHGHEITSTWIWSTANDDGLGGVKDATLEYAWSMVNLEQLGKTDVLISFSEPEASPYTRGGRHVEFGIAIARMIGIVIIGRSEHCFSTLVPSDWKFDNFGNFLSSIEEIEEAVRG